jgi:hypothetical protein
MTTDTVLDARERPRSQRWLPWGVALAVVVQVTVPAIALFNHPPTRFGFQMYSGKGSNPKITAVDHEGHREQIPLAAIVADPRPEIDWMSHVSQYLCASRPDIVSVHIVTSDPPQDRRFACSR